MGASPSRGRQLSQQREIADALQLINDRLDEHEALRRADLESQGVINAQVDAKLHAHDTALAALARADEVVSNQIEIFREGINQFCDAVKRDTASKLEAIRRELKP